MARHRAPRPQLDIAVKELATGWQVQLLSPGRGAQRYLCACEEDARRFAARLRTKAPASADAPAPNLTSLPGSNRPSPLGRGTG
ncbi:MAG: hypothetical protein L0Y66_05270 [Myxococcaceae bacterium]|nr:hypothetical protein [Myxococcaceae bacterium]MCI0670582.1 hypothetical protein [Myxococcaceae bacterium]